MIGAGRLGKTLLGAGVLAVSVLIPAGLDNKPEVALVDTSPAWLMDLTTRS